jgi:hypothetical protein
MERLRPQMKQIARYAIECGYGRMKYRSHTFELFGLDYMLDENLTVHHSTSTFPSLPETIFHASL